MRDQLGHHSIQITVDTYGHLVPGGNRAAVDRLDAVAPATSRSQGATKEPSGERESEEKPVSIDKGNGGAWTRTTDLGIMRPSL